MFKCYHLPPQEDPSLPLLLGSLVLYHQLWSAEDRHMELQPWSPSHQRFLIPLVKGMTSRSSCGIQLSVEFSSSFIVCSTLHAYFFEPPIAISAISFFSRCRPFSLCISNSHPSSILAPSPCGSFARVHFQNAPFQETVIHSTLHHSLALDLDHDTVLASVSICWLGPTTSEYRVWISQSPIRSQKLHCNLDMETLTCRIVKYNRELEW